MYACVSGLWLIKNVWHQIHLYSFLSNKLIHFWHSVEKLMKMNDWHRYVIPFVTFTDVHIQLPKISTSAAWGCINSKYNMYCRCILFSRHCYCCLFMLIFCTISYQFIYQLISLFFIQSSFFYCNIYSVFGFCNALGACVCYAHKIQYIVHELYLWINYPNANCQLFGIWKSTGNVCDEFENIIISSKTNRPQ